MTTSLSSDGILHADIVRRKGVACAIVSGRGSCPVEMVTAIVMQSWPTNTTMHFVNIYGMATAAGRVQAVREAREKKCKYIWFIDDDTVPPTDAGRHLLYLLDQNGPPYGKVMVAGGIYCTRSAPPEPIVYMEESAGPHWDWKVGETFKCWGIGTGCMMINLEVFDHIPEPWFLTTMEAANKETDDLYFCKQVAKAGFEIMAHGGILCHHYDMEKGAVYMLPRNSHPYKDRISDAHEPRLAQAV
jgi:hypothetical protein